MIRSLQIADPDHAIRLNGHIHFDFSPGLNIVVGANGAGKSTLLNLFLSKEGQFANFDADGPTEIKSHSSANRLEESKSEFGSLPALLTLRRLRSSTGQHLRVFLRALTKETGQAGGRRLIVIDEPEMSLDMTEIMLFIGNLRRLVDQGDQAIIATHSPLLMTLPGAHYLELTHGWLDRSREIINALQTPDQLARISDLAVTRDKPKTCSRD